MEGKQRHHVPDESAVLRVLTEKLYSLLTATVSQLLEVYSALNQAKAFSPAFENSNTYRSSLAKSVGISSREGTNLLTGYTKIVLQFQANLELLQRATQKKMAVGSLVSHQNKVSGFSEPAYQSSVCNYPFNECDDWLFKDGVAKMVLQRTLTMQHILTRVYHRRYPPIIRMQISPTKYLVRLLPRQ